MTLRHPRRQPEDIASSSPSTHSIPEGEALLLSLPAQPSSAVAAPNEAKGTIVAAILIFFISDLTYCKLVSDMIQIYGSQMVETGLWAAVVLLIISAIAVHIARRWHALPEPRRGLLVPKACPCSRLRFVPRNLPKSAEPCRAALEACLARAKAWPCSCLRHARARAKVRAKEFAQVCPSLARARAEVRARALPVLAPRFVPRNVPKSARACAKPRFIVADERRGTSEAADARQQRWRRLSSGGRRDQQQCGAARRGDSGGGRLWKSSSGAAAEMAGRGGAARRRSCPAAAAIGRTAVINRLRVMIDHPSNKDMVDIVNSCILIGVGGKKARSDRRGTCEGCDGRRRQGRWRQGGRDGGGGSEGRRQRGSEDAGGDGGGGQAINETLRGRWRWEAAPARDERRERGTVAGTAAGRQGTRRERRDGGRDGGITDLGEARGDQMVFLTSLEVVTLCLLDTLALTWR
ncbi:hypothetical protein Scep_008269 [Stephania cephalantha]|uniref:Uncharacterized protein n=1 Tax=Stephania cephalantha TaxID=152367 RepID=A0AAP0PMJ8_9MAGN